MVKLIITCSQYNKLKMHTYTSSESVNYVRSQFIREKKKSLQGN